jgi:hypothetical protein
MKSDEVIDHIIEHDGHCYSLKGGICGKCPLYDNCLQLMIVDGIWVDPTERVQMALDYVVEKAILDE